MKKQHSSITISKEIYDKFKKYCDKYGYSVSKLVTILIEQKIEDKNL